MARSKTTPTPAAAAAAAPPLAARKSAGLKAPKSATKKPQPNAAPAPEVVVVAPAEGKYKVKRQKKKEDDVPVAAAAAASSPEPPKKEVKAKRKVSRKIRIRAADKHEALAQSGRIDMDGVEVKISPSAWKALATCLHAAFSAPDKPRIGERSSCLIGHLGAQWTGGIIADANRRKLGEFVLPVEPVLPLNQEDKGDMKLYAEKMASYTATQEAYAAARLGSRIQKRHAEEAVKADIYRRGGPSGMALLRAFELEQAELDYVKGLKDAARAKEVAARDARDNVIDALTKLAAMRELTEREERELQTAQHENHLADHRKQVALVEKYTRTIANGRKEIEEIKGDGAKAAAEAIEMLSKVTIPDTEEAIALVQEAIVVVDKAYESFRKENAAPIFAILKDARSKEQNGIIKELNAKEGAKKRVRTELKQLSEKLVRQQLRLEKMKKNVPKRDDLVAEVEERIARNQIKLAEAIEKEKECKRALTRDTTKKQKIKKLIAAQAAAAAAAAAAESDESDDDSSEMSDE